MKKILIIFLALTFSFTRITAQSIRKDYREFTQQEMNDYVAALNILFSQGTITEFQEAHSEHGTSSPIHTVGTFNGEQFLPWHRFFQIDMEQRLKATNTSYAYLSIPYWNWTTDQNRFESQFWDVGFLNENNFPGWGINRPFPGGTLPSPTELANALNLTTFFTSILQNQKPTATDFSHRNEWLHDRVHGWVGGTMGFIASSPGDPIFYLHHSMVDKVWQDWEDRNTSIQASFPNGNTPMTHYSTAMGYPFNVTPNMMLDSRNVTRPAIAGSGRNIDVWYAENGRILLDGANGSPFIATDASASYTYRYTAATSAGSSTFNGSIYVGDVQRDASGNVIDDNKGGFEINNAVKCNFLAGREIIFRNGFWAKSGSQMVAKIITSPNEPAPLRPAKNPVVLKVKPIEQKDLKGALAIKVFPNPIRDKGILQYGLKEASSVEITLTDVLGRTIKVIEKQVKEKGNYTAEINTSYLPAGIYFCKILIGKQAKVFKIVK